jgi:hypothetical protein
MAATDLPAAPAIALAYVTSTDRFAWDEAELAGLRGYADADGLILFDAAGGSREAVAAFEDALRALYPAGALAPLPLDHPIYSTVANGPARAIAYRKAAMDRLPRTQLPRLKGFTANGRLVAIVSEEDLCSGWVGHEIDGIVGYAPKSAVDLLRGILRTRQTAPAARSK